MSAPPVIIPVTLSVPATASTTTLGARFNVPSPYSNMIVIASLTGMSAGTLDMYIQESWDNGVTFYDVAHFTPVGIAATTSVQRHVIAKVGTPLAIGSAGTPALAANKFVDGPWAPCLRLVAVTGVGVNSGAVVQTVSFVTL